MYKSIVINIVEAILHVRFMGLNPLKKILLVDDDADILTIVKYCLERQINVAVSCAQSGEEAMKIVLLIHPDLIILDVLMPKMDGVALYKAIRRIPDFALIPIVFFTASRIQESDIQEYLDLGAAGVIAKPFDPMTLSSQIQAIWERKQKS